ncbi:HNH endonuclease [Salmonella enterica]|uniref:HNH endonuclease n=1 Tax=Salmonella enterica TaxID=28901 RepID=UPI001276854C|nr:HNH endonuclease [Salmonella enterica]EBZ6268940.1 HNH endonuclease [Salmonella enterica subsp. enterica serovar Oranienburg]EDB4570070.1 HNH endonuclease [Salmonella enterica subsp. enterica serovar Panama]ECA1475167.1 HNH endonuclease [Salmonella enterica subsp. enterica serovar Oranienburg]ECA9001043.1 HNH endonuclease [Salmonella enterica subsp. enterica serovar Oranienburg]
MARRSKKSEPETLRKQLLELITDFEHKLAEDSLREQVLYLIPANHLLRDLGSSLMHEEGCNSARDRILAYLIKYPRVIIHGDELMVVAGISEYARRIRELRVQFGWSVLSGTTLKEMIEQDEITLEELQARTMTALKTDVYALMTTEQDREAALRWNEANILRRSKLSTKDKILSYLRKNVGRPVTGEELRYLANDSKEWARRTRELRTEEGWPIATRNSGRPELEVGAYLLEEDRQAEVHDRKIPDPVRVAVLERDHHACRNCGWSHARKTANDPRTFLELHHIEHHADGGENTLDNLITLCNVCHDDVHRRKVSGEALLHLLKGA